MHRQCVLLTLMLIFNQDFAYSHMLTTSRDLPLSTCTRLLAFAVNELCAMYGESSEEPNESFGNSRELASRRNDMRMHLLKRCCLKPCTMTELMSNC